jgi:lipopolysaccharide export system protein LptA
MMGERQRYRILFILILGVFGFLFPAAALTEEASGSDDLDETGSIVIHSDSLEIDSRQKLVTFSGRVRAEREDFVIHSDRMLLYYVDSPSSDGSKGEDIQIDRIVAMGGVRIIRTEGGLATAEKAVYYQAEEKAILTGNPIVRQGEDFVEGAKITLYLKEKRSVVEGSDGKKVRVVISR